MALTVEDGTGTVAGANSYVDLEDARAYASDRGYSLPADDAVLTHLLIRATDYLEGLAGRYKGSKYVPETQSLQWPRLDVVIDGIELDPTEIPEKLKFAQIQAAVEIQTVDPLQTTSGYAIRRERVDVIETEYAIGTNMTSETPLPRMPKVDALLSTLMRGSGNLTVYRA